MLAKDKFVAKAMGKEYLVDNFLSDMVPITQNPDRALLLNGEDWKKR